MKFNLRVGILLFSLMGCWQTVYAQDNPWVDINGVEAGTNGAGRPQTLSPDAEITDRRFSFRPAKYRLLQLNETLLQSLLDRIAPRDLIAAGTLQLPLPNGKMLYLEVNDDPVMEPGLANRFPEFRTYKVRSLGDTAVSGRISVTSLGFHGILQTEQGTVFIDPRVDEVSGQRYYFSYYKADYKPAEKRKQAFQCEAIQDPLHAARSFLARESEMDDTATVSRTGDVLKNYRIAVAATAEYTSYHGGTTNALAAIVNSINRVNQIFNRELGIHLTLVSNNNSIIYTNAASDPYSNGSTGTMLGENQTNLDLVIGSANYDVGHVFGTRSSGWSGIASLGQVCDGSYKGRGVSTSSNPLGDTFDIELLAHELGHQFGAHHSFNSTSGNCGGNNRSGISAVEPGSGSTIMSYAGNCGSNNLQENPDYMFHAHSIQQIRDYVTDPGTVDYPNGDACDTTTATGNNIPTASADAAHTIPAETAFELSGSATDDDNSDVLTYTWEQMDAGTASNWDVVHTDNALFRSFMPDPSPLRIFPRFTDLLNGTSTIGEILPDISRELNFRFTVRDQNSGFDETDTVITVHDTGKPFVMTSHGSSASFLKGETTTVTWDVASTTSAPISCNAVDITLSVNGGVSFPHVLAAATANDGTQPVTLPNVDSANVRIKVKCSTSVFLDINNSDLTIGTPSTYKYETTSSGAVGHTASNCESGSPLVRTISVADDIVIDDIQLGLNIRHFWRGALQVDLTSPGGTSVRVIKPSYERDGTFESASHYDLLLDDDSSLSPGNDVSDDTTAPYYDRVAGPDSPMYVFIGETALGDWTLSMCQVDYWETSPDGTFNRAALFLNGESAGPPDADSDGIPDTNDGTPDNPDTDGDGKLDGADPDIDGDGIDNADDTDAFDPDMDGDGIMDGLDDQPGVSSNLCSGVDATFENVNVSSPLVVTCAATGSVEIAPTVIVNDGAGAKVITPITTILPGFSVPAGATLEVQSVSPLP